MKHINITSRDIVNSMTDDIKHSLAMNCLVNHTDPGEVLENVSIIITNFINIVIDLCNEFFETPTGKEYLNIRKKIENIGGKQ